MQQALLGEISSAKMMQDIAEALRGNF
jgi:hypothetical protein